MRHIYADEAGTSDNTHDRWRVVAAVIIQAGAETESLEKVIEELFDERVPAVYRKDFVFHGTEIYGGRNINWDIWSPEARRSFFEEFVALPQRHNLPIAACFVQRGAYSDQTQFEMKKDDWKAFQSPNKLPFHNYKTAVLEHLFAFQGCAARADFFLRKYLGGREPGVLIAEDVPERRQILQGLGLMFRDSPLVFDTEHQRPTRLKETMGIRPDFVVKQIAHIEGGPSFFSKHEAPLLQLADASAYALRRGLSRQDGGARLLRALLGEGDAFHILTDPIYTDGHHNALFNTMAYWSEEQLAQVRRERAAHLALLIRDRWQAPER